MVRVKTTIIESCLNATTGQLPFGGAEKGSFVHDPRVLRKTELRAQIRFTFRAKNGNDVQVTRTFQTNHKRGKISTQTIDASLAYRDETTRKVVACTFRCADIDKMVPELLGVNSSMLQNVIFCHQDDGNWPLGASSDVKHRLDAIFDSTKYVNALERLREQAKSYRAQVKQTEATLLMLHEVFDQAKVIREDITKKEAQVARLTKKSADLSVQCGKWK